MTDELKIKNCFVCGNPMTLSEKLVYLTVDSKKVVIHDCSTCKTEEWVLVGKDCEDEK